MSTSAELLQPLPGAIEPRWWSGTPALPAESFTIDCAGYAMDAADLDTGGGTQIRGKRVGGPGASTDPLSADLDTGVGWCGAGLGRGLVWSDVNA